MSTTASSHHEASAETDPAFSTTIEAGGGGNGVPASTYKVGVGDGVGVGVEVGVGVAVLVGSAVGVSVGNTIGVDEGGIAGTSVGDGVAEAHAAMNRERYMKLGITFFIIGLYCNFNSFETWWISQFVLTAI